MARLCCLLSIALLACPGAVLLRAEDDLASLLAKPISPGSLAVLIPHARDSRVLERWRSALGNPDPGVRATAARLLSALGVRGITPDLRAALATEPDENAAVELGRALLGPGRADEDAVFDAAARLASDDLALAIARTRGPAALIHVERFRALQLAHQTEEEVVSLLVARQQSGLDGVAQAALAASDVDLWRAVLAVAHSQELDVSGEHLQAALVSASAEIADLAWWHVAVLAAWNEPLPPAARDIAPPPQVRGTVTPPELAFGRDLAARAQGAAPIDRPEFLARVRSREADLSLVPFGRSALAGPLNSFLTDAERKALDIEPPSTAERKRPRNALRQPELPRDYSVIRTVGELPDGYVADVLRHTGCKPERFDQLAGAVVRYTEGRGIQDVRWVATTLPKECDTAARYIVTAGLVPPRAKSEAGLRELVLLPVNKDALQCLASSEQRRPGKRPPRPARVRAPRIHPPKKTRHVAPRYPVSAQNAGRQGLVILESTITRRGCVREIEVLRSAATDLDTAAIGAVSQWRFTPTLLDGEPVPVLMTVTVDFKLQ